MIDTIFEQFVEATPGTVMVRGITERIFQPQALDELLETHAVKQYTRELLFSNVVSLMSLVVSGIHPSVSAAYKALEKTMGVSRPATKLILSTLSLLLTVNLACPHSSQATTKELDVDISNSSDFIIDNQKVEQNITKTSSKTENQIIFDKIISNLSTSNISSQSIGNIMQKVAENFLGAKYTAGLLDRSNQETLVISLTEFDCLLFIETVLALSRNIALQEHDYQAFANNIVNQRYWNGNLDGYCSRLHYFSEWIYDNQKRSNIEDISMMLGGTSQQKKLNFMSKHRSSYSRLINDDANYQCIVSMEENIQIQSIPTNYIPKQKIKNIYQQLKPGDIIGVTTNIAGLDVTHTGLAYYSGDGKVGFIHASPIGKVTIANDLQNYVERVSKSTGIVVVRPIDPRNQD